MFRKDQYCRVEKSAHCFQIQTSREDSYVPHPNQYLNAQTSLGGLMDQSESGLKIAVRAMARRLKKSTRMRRADDAKKYAIAGKYKERAVSGLACVTIIKDETLYLPEWIEFHLMQGFNHFYIYDNGSTDNLYDVMEKYCKQGLVTITPWRNFSASLHPQKSANAHALANYCHNYRWTAFFDVDEFIFSPTHDNLLKPLADRDDQVCICLPWHNFGPDGHVKAPDGLVIKNYTEKAVFPPDLQRKSLLRYKTILNPAATSSAGTHCFHFHNMGPALINEIGQRIPIDHFQDPKYAIQGDFQLNHYFTRSVAELAEKVRKGRVSSQGNVVENFVESRLRQYEIKTCRDTKIHKHLEELKRRMS